MASTFTIALHELPLLPGWAEYLDGKYGQPYYYNHDTGATTWERPSSYEEDEDIPPPPPTAPPPRSLVNNSTAGRLSQVDSFDWSVLNKTGPPTPLIVEEIQEVVPSQSNVPDIPAPSMAFLDQLEAHLSNQVDPAHEIATEEKSRVFQPMEPYPGEEQHSYISTNLFRASTAPVPAQSAPVSSPIANLNGDFDFTNQSALYSSGHQNYNNVGIYGLQPMRRDVNPSKTFPKRKSTQQEAEKKLEKPKSLPSRKFPGRLPPPNMKMKLPSIPGVDRASDDYVPPPPREPRPGHLDNEGEPITPQFSRSHTLPSHNRKSTGIKRGPRPPGIQRPDHKGVLSHKEISSMFGMGKKPKPKITHAQFSAQFGKSKKKPKSHAEISASLGTRKKAPPKLTHAQIAQQFGHVLLDKPGGGASSQPPSPRHKRRSIRNRISRHTRNNSDPSNNPKSRLPVNLGVPQTAPKYSVADNRSRGHGATPEKPNLHNPTGLTHADIQKQFGQRTNSIMTAAQRAQTLPSAQMTHEQIAQQFGIKHVSRKSKELSLSHKDIASRFGSRSAKNMSPRLSPTSLRGHFHTREWSGSDDSLSNLSLDGRDECNSDSEERSESRGKRRSRFRKAPDRFPKRVPSAPVSLDRPSKSRNDNKLKPAWTCPASRSREGSPSGSRKGSDSLSGVTSPDEASKTLKPPPPAGPPPSPRERTVEEVISTERKYVSQLVFLIKHCTTPLIDLCTKEFTHKKGTLEIITLLTNLSIIRNLNIRFLKSLQNSVDKSDKTIAKVFLEHVPFFKMYTTYGMAYQKATDHIEGVMETSGSSYRKFRGIVEQSFDHPAASGLDFDSFLIMPIQRLPRYSLLLRDLLKHTPEGHMDHDQLKEAIGKIGEVNESINKDIYETQKREALLDVCKQFTTDPGFIAPSRSFLTQGTLLKLDDKEVWKEFEFFLFNDMLAHAATSKIGKKYTLKGSLQFNRGLGVKNMADFPTSGRHCFKVMGMGKYSEYVLSAESEQAKIEWIRQIDQAVGHSQNQKIK